MFEMIQAVFHNQGYWSGTLSTFVAADGSRRSCELSGCFDHIQYGYFNFPKQTSFCNSKFLSVS